MRACVCVRVYARSSEPRYSSLLAKCLHALFEANVHEILMYSHIPPEKRSRARAIFVDDAQVSDARECACISMDTGVHRGQLPTYRIETRATLFFPLFLSFFFFFFSLKG